MTIQEKTAAIKKIVADHQDNQTAVKNANLAPGLDNVVVAALNQSITEALVKVFASSPAKSLGKADTTITTGISPAPQTVAGFGHAKSTRKSKTQPSKEKRDFPQTAFAVFQKATGIKQANPRHADQHHSRSGRGR